jgi:hypothetical protein
MRLGRRGRLNDVAMRPGRGSSGGARIPRPLPAAVRGAAWCPSPPSALPGRYPAAVRGAGSVLRGGGRLLSWRLAAPGGWRGRQPYAAAR